jgi:hypothetical protein
LVKVIALVGVIGLFFGYDDTCCDKKTWKEFEECCNTNEKYKDGFPIASGCYDMLCKNGAASSRCTSNCLQAKENDCGQKAQYDFTNCYWCDKAKTCLPKPQTLVKELPCEPINTTCANATKEQCGEGGLNTIL